MLMYTMRSSFLVILLVVRDACPLDNATQSVSDVRSTSDLPDRPLCLLMDPDVVASSTPASPDVWMCAQEGSDLTTIESVEDVEKPTEASSKVDYVGYVFVPLLLIIGFIGNGLTIAVMRSPDFRKMSVSLILSALAVSDTFLIAMLPFNRVFVVRMLGTDIRAFSPASCKIFYFVWRCAKMTSSWLIVLICLERLIAVWLPLHTARICSRRNTALGIVAVYVSMAIFNGAWAYHADVLEGGRCLANKEATASGRAAAQAFILAGSFIYFVAPGILMLVLTAAICFRLLQQRTTRRRMATGGQEQRADETGKTTAMLLCVAITFVCLVAPTATSHIYSFLTGNSFFYSSHPSMSRLREATQVLEQANYSINFFLYVIGSRSFRLRVQHFLGCRKQQQQQQKSQRKGSAYVAKTASLAKNP